MANTVQYVVSKGFNKNIFLEGRESYDMEKIGVAFFPGNAILNPAEKEVESAEQVADLTVPISY